MGLITQCPACHTLFKVVADQLKISDGWVRCGQCREVFDAQAHWAQGEVNDVLSGQSSAQLQTFKIAEVSNAEVDTGAEQILPRNEKSPLVPVTSNRLSGYQDFASSDWINSVNPPAPTNPDIADESDVVVDLHLAEMPSAAGNGAALLSENTDSNKRNAQSAGARLGHALSSVPALCCCCV
jgi:predicted Zn finger-like uncharacterized protein